MSRGPIRLEGAQMRVRQRGKLFSLVVTLLLLTAGTLIAQDVRYNFMPRTDFSKYRTYKWVFLTSMTRHRRSSSGLEVRPRQLTPVQTTKRTNNAWTRP